ncbi:MAG: polysaccharide deacetylase family protein [Bacteroidia bacterium]|nr:polysaccharide deacetylase family protein [Bacteroidia bacterium]
MQGQKIQKVKISVIIPARNEEKYIESVIKSVKAQDFNEYEIIVVDNGSTDKTAEIAKNLGARVVFEPTAGLPRAREKGRNVANADLLVYLDADMIIPPSYLSKLICFFEENKKVVAISNPYLFYDGNWRIKVLEKIAFKILFPLFHKLLKVLKLPVALMGGNFAVKKNILEEIGGFNKNIEFYGEDVDISKRISKKGDIAFIENLYSLTSARRYMQQGIFRTYSLYFANYFSMLLFNVPYHLTKFKLVPKFKLAAKYAALLIVLFVGFFIYSFTYPKSEIFGPVIYRLNYPDKVIALTFDDGPNSEYTEQVLDILEMEGIKGTFFLIGKNVEVYPQIAREIVEQGHSVGNHSYTHPWSLSFETRKAVIAEVKKAEEAIYNANGVRPDLFRPPHGFRTPWMIHNIHKMGFKIVTWDDMTTDYYARSKPEEIAKKILSKVKPGSIIVFHDGLNLNHGVDRENTIKALRIVINELKKESYKFVSLNEIGKQK